MTCRHAKDGRKGHRLSAHADEESLWLDAVEDDFHV